MPYLIFTDLDGTLLDHDSYSLEPARPALEALEARDIPLVFCTSKSRAEVEPIRAQAGNRHPFIVENGAAIFVPPGYFSHGEQYEAIRLGRPYAEAVDVLRRASAASGCRVRGFHQMTAGEIAAVCGLGLEAAERAKAREFDEPFQILSESRAIRGLLTAIEGEGFTWTRGGRFYHVRGGHNKGQAAQLLMDLYRRAVPGVVTIGIGDGPNDISLLEAVDVPLMKSGPRAWNRAILGILKGAPVPGSIPVGPATAPGAAERPGRQPGRRPGRRCGHANCFAGTTP
jgi:mannosyl-3-phosphoglycerate phosphatase